MDTNLKFMSEDIHFRCTSLGYCVIAVKQIDLFDVWQMIIYQLWFTNSLFYFLPFSPKSDASVRHTYFVNCVSLWICEGKNKLLNINLRPKSEVCWFWLRFQVGLLTGAIGLMLLQNLSDWLKSVLGDSELPIKQLKDLLPLTTVPIFRRSIYESDLAETIFEVSSNPAYS